MIFNGPIKAYKGVYAVTSLHSTNLKDSFHILTTFSRVDKVEIFVAESGSLYHVTKIWEHYNWTGLVTSLILELLEHIQRH